MALSSSLYKACIKALLLSIALYQRTISPDHGIFKLVYGGPVCRFNPTCSEYTAQAIQQHGFAGIGMGIKRILRCNPFVSSL